MIRRPPRSTQSRSSAASDVYKRQVLFEVAAGGALASAVVPLLALPLARSMRKDVDRTASAMLGWALAVLVPLAVVVAVLARPLVGVFMPGATVAELGVAASFLAMFAVQIPLYGAGLVLTGVLQAHRRFLAAALARPSDRRAAAADPALPRRRRGPREEPGPGRDRCPGRPAGDRAGHTGPGEQVRAGRHLAGLPVHPGGVLPALRRARVPARHRNAAPVSYTHLTLPTIYSV